MRRVRPVTVRCSLILSSQQITGRWRFGNGLDLMLSGDCPGRLSIPRKAMLTRWFYIKRFSDPDTANWGWDVALILVFSAQCD